MTVEMIVSKYNRMEIKDFHELTLHDVVTVSDETEADSQGDDSDLPQGHISLGADSLTS